MEPDIYEKKVLTKEDKYVILKIRKKQQNQETTGHSDASNRQDMTDILAEIIAEQILKKRTRRKD